MNKISYSGRRNTIMVIILAVTVIFVFRLLYIQVLSSKWIDSAQSVSETKRAIQPSRGLIFDRNGLLLANNRPAYELHVTPYETTEFDTVQLCDLIGAVQEKFTKKLKHLRGYAKKKRVIHKKIPFENVAKLKTILYRYKGFEIQNNSARYYPSIAASHLLGYVREVDSNNIKKDNYYHSRDVIGKGGLELQYESYLRGKRGYNRYLKDKFGNLKEVVSVDSAVKGNDLTTTIDLKLQEYGYKLMQNKIGSIIAIEPSTGEILASISAPTFDPNTLTTDSISKLHNPNLNRPLQSKNPPGSIFKMIQGLISLETGAITPNTGIACNKGLVGCHNHPKANTLAQAIKYSCNPYFFQTLGMMSHIQEGKNIHEKTKTAMGIWTKSVKSFGLGADLNLDIPYYNKGNIPDTNLYNKMYKGMGWNYRTCNSISIGQGEILVTPVQMANLAATLANRGHFYYPHFVRSINNNPIDSLYTTPNYTEVDGKYFPLIADAMQQVIEGVGGTARMAKIDGITVCGKTGTAQNPQGEDHSVFIAFAPKENPKIAIAVYIENAGFGGTWAAPTASLMMEKYLTDTIKNKWKEKRILDANLIPKGDD